MANEQNLIPFSERSESEAREMGANGGIASGVARRKKKALKTVLDELLTRGICSKKDLALAEDFELKDDVTQEQLVMAALLKAAKGGNVQAVKEIRSITRDDEQLKLDREKLKIEQEKLRLLKERQGAGGDALEKLDEVLGKIGI